MSRPSLLCALLLVLGTFGKCPALARRAAAEKDEVDYRLEAFYARPSDPEIMNRRPPKFRSDTGRAVDPNPWLRLRMPSPSDPLLQSAQAKATAPFHAQRCRYLRAHFPKLRCRSDPGEETQQPNDRVEDLTESWIPSAEVTDSLDRIPWQGKVSATTHWSGDYWPIRMGLTSFRYGEGKSYKTYREAVAAYEQPRAWIELSALLDPSLIARSARHFSPAEKFDLTAGDWEFTLTNQQKRAGERYLLGNDNVPLWMGICHGWAAAAIMVPAPLRPVTAQTASPLSLTWFPDDIRAMLTLAWANGDFDTNFIGGRCDDVNPERYGNGRLINRDCFDSNPATFHRALGNLIGLKGISFIMDSSYDYQVWNQPIVEYELEYFNPLDPTVRTRRWHDAAVPYDAAFKSRDRFQKPLTRGRPLQNGKYDDSAIRQVVGVIATITYLYEVSPTAGPEPTPNSAVRVSYTYDLELTEKNGALAVTGGEWHQNAHPDFLWVPRRNAYPRRPVDTQSTAVRLEGAPSAALTGLARQGAREAYPYCPLLAALAAASNGTPYSCTPAQGYR